MIDANGNRSETRYDNMNRVVQTTAADPGGIAGRLTSPISTATEYIWDYRNRLTGVVTKDSGGIVTEVVVYTYDVYDRRITKSVDADGAGRATGKHFVDDHYESDEAKRISGVRPGNDWGIVTLSMLKRIVAVCCTGFHLGPSPVPHQRRWVTPL
ncbi:hypothetical protein [Nodosilinea sp. LEGE 07088]|uniref:hypothetical protein n=1 Tax=Nodosilinea sp. LEGE 07088 TaxID=2777968 RepID=UPI001D1499B9|nr:hypothetical protein [Nodosilinea sp. LEGE 07088]